MFRPDKNDPIKIRRWLAVWATVYSFLFPHFVFAYVIIFNLPVDIAKAAFLYIGGLASGPIAAYLYAAHRNGNSETRKTKP